MTVQTRRPSAARARTPWPQGTEPETPTVPRWKPPLEAAGLSDMLGLLRRWAWTALDSEALLDDVAIALDDIAPAEEDIEESVERLRGHLIQLVDIAVSTRVWQQSAYADTLIQRARALRAEEMPGDHRRAVPHLRQMAWNVSELLDQLVALHSIQGAV